jgi:hypothetical protein
VLAAEVCNTSHKNARSLGLDGVSKQSVVVLLLYGTSGGVGQGRFCIFIKVQQMRLFRLKSNDLLPDGEFVGRMLQVKGENCFILTVAKVEVFGVKWFVSSIKQVKCV